MEQRNKTLYVSKTMKQKRAEDFERITSPYGIQLRVNRSIQAERSFASVKQDMEFRRYMYRGKENVTAQSVILAIAHNINKLHNKIQSEKTGQHCDTIPDIPKKKCSLPYACDVPGAGC